MSDRQQQIISAFVARFGREPAWLAEAPGRVNLIGEHTDYNDGFVLPVAIDRTALVAAAPARGRLTRLLALDLREEVAFDPSQPRAGRDRSWSNYVKGVAWALAEAGYPAVPVDVAIQSSVPMGAGLSSSAALEVASVVALAAAGSVSMSPLEVAQLAHRAETDFVGVPCGIMDQFISALAVEDHGLLIDCRTLDAEPVPLALREQEAAIVVVESGVSRELARSAYQDRRSQCDRAMELLRPWLAAGAGKLRDVTPGQLNALAGRLPPPLLQRARHVVTENRRVLRFARAIRERRLGEAGELMGESHRSLRDDYQVSSPELDLLVELAQEVPGVIGARLTGAGFGGCTVNLVETGALAVFQKRVVDEYCRRTGRTARAYPCRAIGGATLLPLTTGSRSDPSRKSAPEV